MFFNDKFSTRPEVLHWWWDETSSMGNFRQVPELGITYANSLDVSSSGPSEWGDTSCCSAIRGGAIGVGYWKGYLQRGKFYSWFSYCSYAWMSFLRLPSPRVAITISGCGHTVLFAQQALETLFVLSLPARWNRLRHQGFWIPNVYPLTYVAQP